MVLSLSGRIYGAPICFRFYPTFNWKNLQVRQRSLLYQFLWVVQVISSKNTRTGLVWLHWCSSRPRPNLFSSAPFSELIRTKVELFPNLASAFALTFFQQSFHSNHLWPLMWKDKKKITFLEEILTEAFTNMGLNKYIWR